jgi:hypothetical protein
MAFDWRSALSAVSAVAAISAAAFAGIQALESRQERQQNAFLMRPSLDFFLQDDATEHQIGLATKNGGPGVARIKSVTFFVERKPMASGDAALKAGALDPDQDHGVELEEGDAIAVGETVWLLDYRSKVAKEREKFLDFLDDHLAVKIEYCTVPGSPCFSRCSTKGWCD